MQAYQLPCSDVTQRLSCNVGNVDVGFSKEKTNAWNKNLGVSGSPVSILII